MKKIIITLLLFLMGSLVWGQFIWDDPGVWVGQEKMIHADDFYAKTVSIETSEGMVFLWVESQEGLAQIYGQKYSFTGESLWEEPILLSAATRFPFLQSGIEDTEGNLIIAYYVLDTENNVRLMKLGSNGEFIWETSWSMEENEYMELRLLPGISSDLYLNIRESYYENILYHFDEEGNQTAGWAGGYSLGGITPNCWQVDENGYLVVFYRDPGDNYKLQRIDPEGNEAFNDGAMVFEDITYHGDNEASFDITPHGDYVCNFDNYVKCITYEGEPSWEFESTEQSNYESRKVLAGEINLYLIAGPGFAIFNYYYDPNNLEMTPSFNWFSSWSEYGSENTGAWLREDDGIRFSYKAIIGYDDYMIRYELHDYSSDGEQLSPEEGWYSEEGNIENHFPVLTKLQSEDMLWMSVSSDGSFQQIMHFVNIDEFGNFVTGDEPVVISTAIERFLEPEEVYVSDDVISVLSKHTGNPHAAWYWCASFVLHRFTSEGIPLDDPEGQILFFQEAELLDRKDNLALFVLFNGSDETAVQLVDLATGEYLWEDGGHLCDPGYIVGLMAGDIYEGGAGYYWQRNTTPSYRIQRIENGEEVFPQGGVNIPFTQTVCYGSWLMDNYVITNLATNSAQHIKYLDEQGVICWEQNFGRSLHYSIKGKFRLIDEGLLILCQLGSNPPTALSCQLINAEGEHLFGEGLTIPFDFDDELYGLAVLDNCFAVFSYNTEANEPIYCSIYNFDGTILQPATGIIGTEGCELVNVKAIDEGMLLFMTRADGRYHTLELGLYDLSCNPVELPCDNPVTCYEEYCRYEPAAAEVYDNDVYFCWESLINRHFPDMGNDGNDVILQGWSVPEVDNDEIVISHTHSSLSLMPNPFNPELKICWNLESSIDYADITIYNIKGQRVREWKIENVKCKTNSVVWDGRDFNGKIMSSGIYFVTLKNGMENISRKALLLK